MRTPMAYMLTIVPKGSVILHEEDILLIVSPNKVEEGESSSLPL